MKIRCPQCATLYDVAEEIVLAGSELQCAVCATIFPAEPFEEPSAPGAKESDAAASAAPEAPDDEAPSSSDQSAAEDDFDAEVGIDAASDTDTALDLDVTDAGGDWEAEIGGWAEAAEAADAQTAADAPVPDADVAPAADPAADLGSLLTEEERALFGALLGSRAAEDTVPEEAPIEPEPVAAAPDEELPGDLDWADLDEAPVRVANEPVPLDEIEVKDPVLPPVETGTNDASETAAEDAEADVAASHVPLWLGWAALGLVLGIVVSTSLVLRVQIATLVPGMAEFYAALGLPVNVRGLEFQRLDHHWQQADGRLRLVVRGEIVNVTARERALPEIVFAMRDERGMEFFQWLERIDAEALPAGGRTRFRAQIPAPPDRVRQVHIRFAK